MNIGEAAEASGVSAKMIRYYEGIGLIPAAGRRASGYRDYSLHDVHRLGFIRRARDLGFEMPQIRELLRLWSDEARSNAEVKAIALDHVAALEERARQLAELAAALKALAAACDGDGRPACPIIEGLEHGTEPPCAGGVRATRHRPARASAGRRTGRRNPRQAVHC